MVAMSQAASILPKCPGLCNIQAHIDSVESRVVISKAETELKSVMFGHWALGNASLSIYG